MHAAAAMRACAALAGLPAVSLAVEDAPQEAPLTQLEPVDAVPEAQIDPGAVLGNGESPLPQTTGEDAPTPATSAAPADAAQDLVGPLEQLRETRARLDAERTNQQAELLRLEARRERAEQRLDAATDQLAQRLIDLFDADEQARLQALIAVRDEGSPEQRAALLAALAARERTLMTEYDAALAAANDAGTKAEAVRLDVFSLGTRVAALDAAIDERDGMTPQERARASGSHYSFDADLVFATGPIPSIGYWGEMAGGGVLDGWMGYAAAAVGGVGCEPPDASLKATGQIEQGEASWYGPGFDGNMAASGEVYDQTAMTAAHKTLPFGTIVRVYSSATGRCAVVRINDRGPYVDGRIIDLSKAAADSIGMSGTAPVQIEVWATPDVPPVASS
jgi:hypothetical protein